MPMPSINQLSSEMGRISIHSLPDELLLRILGSIDLCDPSNQNAFTRLSQASRRLRRLTLHRVYDKVLIQREPNQGSNRTNPVAGIFISLYNIDAFIEGLKRWPELTDYIHQLRIDWTPYRLADNRTHSDRKRGWPGMLNAKGGTEFLKKPIVLEDGETVESNAAQEYDRIQELLRIFKNQNGGRRTHVYLCVNLWRKDKFAEWLLPLLKLDPIQTLELVLPPKPQDHLIFACYRKSGLEHLLLSNMEIFEPLDPPPTKPDPRANITDLSLRVLAYQLSTFKAALIPPKALRSLHIQLQPDFNGRFMGNTQDIGPGLFSSHIHRFRESLQEFFFSVAGQHKGEVLLSTLDGVSDFPVLKRVGVPSYFLIHFKEDVEMAGEVYDALVHAPRLSAILPKSIEELQIEFDPNEQTLEWNTDPDDESTPISTSAQELLIYLSNIHENKVRAFPELKKLALWQRDDIYAPFGPPPRFEEVSQCMQRCKQEKIELSYHVNESPPLFGVYD